MGLNFLFNRSRRFVAVAGLTLAAASAQPASSAPLSITYNTEFAFDVEHSPAEDHVISSPAENHIRGVHTFSLETFPAERDDLTQFLDGSWWLEDVSVSHEIRATARFTWTSKVATRFGVGMNIGFNLWADGISGQDQNFPVRQETGPLSRGDEVSFAASNVVRADLDIVPGPLTDAEGPAFGVARVFAMPLQHAEEATLSVEGTHTMRFGLDLPEPDPTPPAVIRTEGRSVPVRTGSLQDPVGTLSVRDGGGTVERADGTVVPIAQGMEVFRGDVVTKDPYGGIDIHLPDGSALQLGDVPYTVETFDFDPTPDGPDRWKDILRGMFVGAGGLVPRPDTSDEDIPVGFLGIRADAADVVKDHLIQNPDSSLFGDVGIFAETASPKAISTFIETPEDPFAIAFDYIFFDADMSLTMSFAGTDLWSTTSESASLGLLQSTELLIDWQAGLNELAFTFDGDSAGLSGIISGVTVDGVPLLEFEDWFFKGEGRDAFVLLADATQRAALQDAAAAGIAPVPIGGSFGFMIAGLLGFLGFARWRSGHRPL